MLSVVSKILKRAVYRQLEKYLTNKKTGILMLDLQKDFDTVDHDILCEK